MSSQPDLQKARRFRIRRNDAHVIQPANPRPQRRDCQGQLLAALRDMTGPDGTIAEAGMRPWCSATFIGAQHRILLRLAGTHDAESLAKQLCEAEFTLRGHIVADVAVDEVRDDGEAATLISLAVLTIEDW